MQSSNRTTDNDTPKQPRHLLEQLELLTRENKLLEQALQEHQALVQALFNQSPTATILVDRQGRIVGYNHAREELGGRLPQIGEIMYKDYANRHEMDMYGELMHCIEIEETRHFLEQKYNDKYIDITISPYSNGAIIMSEDVTKRKTAEEAVRHAEHEKHLILSSVSEIVCYQNLNHKIMWVNRAGGDIVGRNPESLVGELCYSIWGKRKSPCEECPIDRVVETRKPFHFEYNASDGTIWERTIYPAVDEHNELTGIVIVMLNITQRKKIAEEREKIQAQLVQAQKMEAVGTLAGGVAHDFNNLITAIHGIIDLAIEHLDKTDPLYADLVDVYQAAERASDLTRQLLLFSRQHPTQFQMTNVNNLITDLLKMLKRLIGEDIVITPDFEEKLWNIKADRGTLEQVIMNLALNARDAMPLGGRLTIRTENVILDESYCSVIHEAKPGRYVRITLADSGMGIHKEMIHRIFEPFFSTKEPGKGTGLGLSVVYGIVKQHQGWINVYSELDHGTEFKIYIPSINEQIPVLQEPEKSTSLEKLCGDGEKILIVEDESCVRDFAERALSRHGYQVFAASTAVEAMELFNEHRDSIDLVFTDVVLPDLNGIDLLDDILFQKESLPVMVCSGYTDSKSQWMVIKKKGYRFLQKPYSLYDLLCAIRETIQKEKDSSDK